MKQRLSPLHPKLPHPARQIGLGDCQTLIVYIIAVRQMLSVPCRDVAIPNYWNSMVLVQNIGDLSIRVSFQNDLEVL